MGRKLLLTTAQRSKLVEIVKSAPDLTLAVVGKDYAYVLTRKTTGQVSFKDPENTRRILAVIGGSYVREENFMVYGERERSKYHSQREDI